MTEDIDILVKEFSEIIFEKFWKELGNKFWCINTKSQKVAFKF